MGLLDRLRRRPAASTTTGPYRAPAAIDPIVELSALIRGQSLRVRALERQLVKGGITPALTPDGGELLEVAEILESLARCEGVPSKHNTIGLAHLGELIRGLAEWTE